MLAVDAVHGLQAFVAGSLSNRPSWRLTRGASHRWPAPVAPVTVGIVFCILATTAGETALVLRPSPIAVLVATGPYCLMGWLLRRRFGGQPAHLKRHTVAKAASPDRIQLVKLVLADIDARRAKRACVLAEVHGIASTVEPNRLRRLLIEAITELASSPNAREAQAGRLLLDYYVKGVGTHEVVMARLFLSRPTFYRRLNDGLEHLARRLDDFESGGTSQPQA